MFPDRCSALCAPILEVDAGHVNGVFPDGFTSPNEYRGQCVACLRNRGTTPGRWRNAAAPRHGHGVARYGYEHDAPVGFCQCSHHLVLGVWQIHVLTVVSFAVPGVVALVQSADEYDIIGTLRLLQRRRQ